MKPLVNFLKSHFYAVIIIIVALSIGVVRFASLETLSFIYSLGLSIKEIILFLLPILIFGCGFRCVMQLKNESTKILVYLLGLIMLSNFIASWAGYAVIQVVPNNFGLDANIETNTLLPLWEFSLFKPISTRIALFGGILIAILFRNVTASFIKPTATKIIQSTDILLSYVLLPLLPFFMFGFLVKMLYEGSLAIIFQQYIALTTILIGTYSLYIFLIFFGVSKFRLKKTFQYLWNLMPAGWLGFSTLSGLAALPLSIQCSEKNIHSKPLAGGLLPLTSNVHMIGESLTITMLSLMVYVLFFGTYPTMAEFAQYSVMWVISAFSIAAVPAGSIMIMIPVLQSVFGFNAEMIAFTTLIYLFIEPLSTTVNIMGNGFLVILIDKIQAKKRSTTPASVVHAPTSTLKQANP